MSSKFVQLQNSFRKKFSLPNPHIAQWYPGHMMKGMLQIQAKLRAIDCVVEVHDARLPFSGRNPNLRNIIELRPHILLLNKADLTDFHENNDKRDKVVTDLKNNGVDSVFFTSFKQCTHQQIVSNILPAVKELVHSRPRYNREGSEDLNMLVVGVPNVGKSTFINSLRNANLKKKGKATEVGALAGITKSVLNKIKVSSNPPTFIIDTPGIMPPKIQGLETGMRLAACACLPDHLIGEVNIADYILFWLNSRRHFDYVDYFQLDQPLDNILDVLAKIAIRNKQILHVKDVVTNQYVYRPNNEVAAVTFCGAFRNGKLGKFTLDDDFK